MGKVKDVRNYTYEETSTGIVEVSLNGKKIGSIIKDGDTSIGFISKIIEAGKDPDSAVFTPFHEALVQYEKEMR